MTRRSSPGYGGSNRKMRSWYATMKFKRSTFRRLWRKALNAEREEVLK